MSFGDNAALDWRGSVLGVKSSGLREGSRNRSSGSKVKTASVSSAVGSCKDRNSEHDFKEY
jgi:hypothetical protein